jgi:hypothetical protein
VTARVVERDSVWQTDSFRETPQDLRALENVPRLRDALVSLDAALADAFDSADTKAMEYQASHRAFANVATWFGTIAVILAIVRLAVEALREPEVVSSLLLGAELVTAAVACVVVIAGLMRYRAENWLLQRVRAERLRARKFAALLEPAAWSDLDADRRTWLRDVERDVDEIQTVQRNDLSALAATTIIPAAPPALDPAAVEPDLLYNLIMYYEAKRLEPQRRYLAGVVERGEESEGRLLPLLFFTSVVLVFVHALLTVLGGNPSLVHVVATFLTVISVSIPIVWAGIRTRRGAMEAGRNATRSHAHLHALRELSDRLHANRENAAQALWTMQMCEFILELDQREWLRLLIAAEWYG